MKERIVMRHKNRLSVRISTEERERFISGHSTGTIEETVPQDFDGFYGVAALIVNYSV